MLDYIFISNWEAIHISIFYLILINLRLTKGVVIRHCDVICGMLVLILEFMESGGPLNLLWYQLDVSRGLHFQVHRVTPTCYKKGLVRRGLNITKQSKHNKTKETIQINPLTLVLPSLFL